MWYLSQKFFWVSEHPRIIPDILWLKEHKHLAKKTSYLYFILPNLNSVITANKALWNKVVDEVLSFVDIPEA